MAMKRAPDILQAGIDAMADRAATRDQPSGERSMACAVAIYHAAKGSTTIDTERDGWLFMVCLKLARAQGGGHNLDDYIDGAAYCALMGEAADGQPGGTVAPEPAPPPAPDDTFALTAEESAEIERISAEAKRRTSILNGIRSERERQIGLEGWTLEHDDQHTDGELASAAACYAMPPHKRALAGSSPTFLIVAEIWPWEERFWKPCTLRQRDLIRAGALIVAELERLERQAERGEPND